MEKVELISTVSSTRKVLHRGKISTVVKLSDGSVLKLIRPNIIKVLSELGVNLEEKVLDSEKEDLDKQIIKPKIAVYNDHKFSGYIMDEAKGEDLETFIRKLSLEKQKDLNMYASIYSNIERIVKKSDQVVFTDLGTFKNIMIDSDFKTSLIDYDGLQVGRHLSGCISTLLGNQLQYNNQKYRKNDYFTKELDIKSLISLYFSMTFGVSLAQVGEYSETLKEKITLDIIFNSIGVDDDIKHKVWKTFTKTEKNEYLGDDVFRLASNNNLEIVKTVAGKSLKKLKKI